MLSFIVVQIHNQYTVFAMDALDIAIVKKSINRVSLVFKNF